MFHNHRVWSVLRRFLSQWDVIFFCTFLHTPQSVSLTCWNHRNLHIHQSNHDPEVWVPWSRLVWRRERLTGVVLRELNFKNLILTVDLQLVWRWIGKGELDLAVALKWLFFERLKDIPFISFWTPLLFWGFEFVWINFVHFLSFPSSLKFSSSIIHECFQIMGAFWFSSSNETVCFCQLLSNFLPAVHSHHRND